MADAIEANAMTEQEIIDLLGEDDDISQDKEKVITETEEANKPKKEEKVESKKEEKEEEPEKEEEEIKLEEDEDYQPHPTRQQILKAYPDLFKKFPTLQSSMFRDEQYTESFATPKDAREAKEQLDEFNNFQTVLLEGDIEPVLIAVKDANPEAFGNIVDTVVQKLGEIDERAFNTILMNFGRTLVGDMWQRGTSAKNEAMQQTAKNLAAYLGLTDAQIANPIKYGKGTTKTKEVNEQEERLREREEELFNRESERYVGETSNRVEGIISASIDKVLDPKGQLTAYEARNLKDDIFAKLDEVVEADDHFGSVLNNLWDKAADNNFSDNSLSKIRNAYLSKAQTVLPRIIKTLRAEALSGRKGFTVKKEEEEEETTGRGNATPRREVKTIERSSGKIRSAKDLPKDKSTLALLNDESW